MAEMNRQKGFTLVEVAIAILASSIVMLAVLTLFTGHQDTYLEQDEVVLMQQRLRSAIDAVTKDLYAAGYNGGGITNMGAATISFTLNMDADGEDNDGDSFVDDKDLDGDLKTITYALTDSDGDGAADDLTRSGEVVAENIKNMEFLYYDKDGNITAVASEVKMIEFALLATQESRVKGEMISQSFTAPSGAPWTTDTGFRGRMASKFVTGRNL
ncbi:PilW family protein [Thiovibrio sp. JS02]